MGWVEGDGEGGAEPGGSEWVGGGTGMDEGMQWVMSWGEERGWDEV